MSRRILVSATILALVIATFGVAPAYAGSNSSKQIVFIMGESWLKFTSVSISGYNQDNQWSTWSTQNSSGVTMAYTKNWWWSANFVKISFTIKDTSGNSVQKTCLIDALAQPANSPRVEIVYNYSKGCVGGDMGSAQDPVKNNIIRPINDAFATINYYSKDFDVDKFLKIVMFEAKATVCIVGVGAALRTGGLSYAAAAATINGSCEYTAKEVLKLFIKP